MALVLADRVRETTTTNGTGTVTLLGAVSGYQSFSVVGNSNTTYYCIASQSAAEWEVGIGTYTSSGTTLSRDTILASSNSGSIVPFTSGTKDVFVTYPAGKSVNYNAAGNVALTGGLTLGSALPVASGGTGQTSYTDGQLLIGNSSGNTLTKATLTQGSGVTITNGNGTITIAATGLGGDVVGPASSTDNAVVRFDGTTGKLVQNSGVLIADDGTTVIEVSSATDALRITQTGAGNALVVEDSANPDSTPFVVDTNGRVVIGNTTGDGSPLSIYGSSDAASYYRFTANTFASFQYFSKSRSSAIGTNSIVLSGDSLGGFIFRGADGTNYIQGASISAAVDGTPGTNDMPGRLVFSTTADGASSPTERMRIGSDGGVGFGGTNVAGYKVLNYGNWTGASTFYGFASQGTIQSDVTSSVYGYRSAPNTADAAFSISNIIHYGADQGTITGGSRTTPTNQFGFYALSSLTGATNNYGFYSGIASGTGRYNFYAAGTADNYFGGPTVVSVNSSSDALRITQTGAGNALVVEDSANPDSSPFVVDSAGQVIAGHTFYIPTVSGLTGGIASVLTSSGQIGYTTNRFQDDVTDAKFVFNKARGSVTTPAVVANNDGLGKLWFTGYDGAAYIRGAVISGEVDGTPGASDMPGRLVFSTTADGASTPTERMRIDNAGNVGIGATPNAAVKIDIGGTYPSSGTESYGLYARGSAPSTSTSNVYGVVSQQSTDNAAFAPTNIRHFTAFQGTITGGSRLTTTNQIGFLVDSGLTGATNNYGFYSNIASGTGRWNFYAAGTANNYFAGAVGVGTTSVGGTTGFTGIRVNPNITGATTAYQISGRGAIQSDVTGAVYIFSTFPSTAAAAFTLSNLVHYSATQSTIGATSAVTNQYGFQVDNTLTGATNNFGFYSNIASGTGRWNFYAADTANNAFAGSSSFGTTSAPTALITIAAGTATANTAPLKFTSGTNLSTPEAGVVEYDGTVMTATTNTNFKRGTVEITNYSSGVGTSLTAGSEATLQVLLPSANDTITLSVGTYFLDLCCTFTRGTTSTTSATARVNILGTGNAVGSFSGMAISSATAASASSNFSFDAVNINTSNVVTAASTTASGVYTITLRGILKITTQGTIIPQYNLSSNLTSAGTATAPKVLYLNLTQLDTQSAAAFGPAGTGWA